MNTQRMKRALQGTLFVSVCGATFSGVLTYRELFASALVVKCAHSGFVERFRNRRLDLCAFAPAMTSQTRHHYAQHSADI